MTTTTGPRLVTSIGFWLPCGRTNFCDITHDKIPGAPTTLVVSVDDRPSKIEDSVCKRLTQTLAARGYALVTRLFPQSAMANEELLPEAIVFVHEGRPQSTVSVRGTLLTDNWSGAIAVDALLLIATTEGFYYVCALHDPNLAAVDVLQALGQHVGSLFGGSFYSHISGHPNAHIDDSPSPQSTSQTIKQYADGPLGILNLFQLTSVIEGLYNSYFDASVFFYERGTNEDTQSYKRSAYALKQFAAMICTKCDVEEGSRDAVVALIDNIVKGNASYSDVVSLRSVLDTRYARTVILRGFLDNTSAYCLRRPLKSMIEQCRSALLSKSLEVIHRREPISQIESPTDDSSQLIENEDQLRGYVMLVSAKLPLIANILNQLEEQVAVVTDKKNKVAKPGRSGNPSPPARSARKPLESSLRAWHRLFSNLVENVRDVERAIAQSRMERLLFEQSQMRAEQETSSEIERVRIRFGLIGSGHAGVNDWGIVVVTCLSTAISVASACALTAFPDVAWLGKVEVISAICAFIVGMYCAIQWMQRRRERRRYLVNPENSEHHYEFDFHLDAPIGQKDAHDLANGGFNRAMARREAARGRTEDASATRMAFADRGPYIHTYRVDRLSNDEAVYKIHIECKVHDTFDRAESARTLASKLSRGREPDLVVSLVYDILVQLASASHQCILRDVRVIALKNTQLDDSQRRRLKLFVIHQCINAFIENVEFQIHVDGQEKKRDPCLYLDWLAHKRESEESGH
jgi:hypothetical protein